MKEYKLLCIRAMIFEQQYDYTNMDIMQLENFKMVGPWKRKTVSVISQDDLEERGPDDFDNMTHDVQDFICHIIGE